MRNVQYIRVNYSEECWFNINDMWKFFWDKNYCSFEKRFAFDVPKLTPYHCYWPIKETIRIDLKKRNLNKHIILKVIFLWFYLIICYYNSDSFDMSCLQEKSCITYLWGSRWRLSSFPVMPQSVLRHLLLWPLYHPIL